MIEYQYDEKKFKKMAVRASLPLLLAMYGVMLAIFAFVFGVAIDKYLKGNSLTSVAILLILSVVILVTVVASIVIFVRQLSKNFAMYCDNGVVHEAVEVIGDEIVVTNFSCNSVARRPKSEIVAVKKYKDFFAVTVKPRVKWVVPFNEQTKLLYNVLTGAAGWDSLPGAKSSADIAANKETAPVESTQDSEGILTFDYQLTEETSVSMLKKVLYKKLRVLLICGIIFSAISLLGLITFFAMVFTGTEVSASFATIFIEGLVFSAVFYILYGVGGVVTGKKRGLAYFENISVNGVAQQSIELYDKGIYVVNKARDTRVQLRFSVMQKLVVCKDFFYLDLTSKEVLPIPLTDSTRKLCDLLKQHVAQRKG